MEPINALRRWLGIRLVATLIMLTIAATAASADGLEDARRRGRLLVGIKTDFAPFGQKDSQGQYHGLDVEIARYLGRFLFGDKRQDQQQVEFVAVTSGSRIPFLFSGWIDVIVATMTITADRQKVLEFSDPYFMSGSLLLVPAVSPIQGLADLAGKSVAVIKDAVQQHDLAQVAPQAAQRSFETVHEALQALKTGQVDAFCQDDVLVLTLAQASSDLKAVGKPFVPRPYAVAVRKGETDFIGWINAALARMRSDGTYAALWQKYFGEIQTHLVKP